MHGHECSKYFTSYRITLGNFNASTPILNWHLIAILPTILHSTAASIAFTASVTLRRFFIICACEWRWIEWLLIITLIISCEWLMCKLIKKIKTCFNSGFIITHSHPTITTFEFNGDEIIRRVITLWLAKTLVTLGDFRPPRK